MSLHLITNVISRGTWKPWFPIKPVKLTESPYEWRCLWTVERRGCHSSRTNTHWIEYRDIGERFGDESQLNFA